MPGQHTVIHGLLSWISTVLTPLSAERDAMGYDEYHPINKSGSNLMDSGVGYAMKILSISTKLPNSQSA